jgi:hypothetical protein
MLIVKNRAYLLGRSMPYEIQKDIVKMLEADPAIEKVLDFKSTTIGWGEYRIKCEVEFNGGALLRTAYRGRKMRDEYDGLKDDFEAFKKFSADYADRIPRLIGRRIDTIEARVRKAHPEVKHIDIELN